MSSDDLYSDDLPSDAPYCDQTVGGDKKGPRDEAFLHFAFDQTKHARPLVEPDFAYNAAPPCWICFKCEKGFSAAMALTQHAGQCRVEAEAVFDLRSPSKTTKTESNTNREEYEIANLQELEKALNDAPYCDETVLHLAFEQTKHARTVVEPDFGYNADKSNERSMSMSRGDRATDFITHAKQLLLMS